MPNRISLTDISSVKIKGRDVELTETIKRNLFKDLTDRKPETVDTLHELIRTDPKTGDVIDNSVQSILIPANLFLESTLKTIGRTLDDESSFPLNGGAPGATQNRSVSMKLDTSADAPTRLPSKSPRAVWRNLSANYLRKIGFQVNSLGKVKSTGGYYRYKGNRLRRSSQGRKRFWSERGRKGSRISGSTGMREEAAALFMAIDGELVRAGQRNPRSLAGARNTFTVSSNLKKRRARSYQRTSTRGKRYVVYSVVGDLYYPNQVDLAHSYSSELSDVLLLSMVTGSAISPKSSLKALTSGLTGRAESDWPALLLANEKTRPWMGSWFSKLQPALIRYLQDELLSDLTI